MSCHPATMSWEAAPVCSTVICFASLVGLPCSLVRGDLMEVCPLSRGVMSLGGSTPISSITEEPSLFPYSFTHTSMGLPCGALSLAGEIWAYHVSSQCQSGLGPSLFARSFPVLTPMYNCARIKLTVPRDGGSLWEMPLNISAGDRHDQEQDSEQDTRLSRARQIDSRHRDQPGDRQKYGAQIPAPPRTGRHAPSAAQSPLQTRSVQRAGAAVDHGRSLLQL